MVAPPSISGSRILLRKLREIMEAGGSAQERLDRLVAMVASTMVADVCSIYLMDRDRIDAVIDSIDDSSMRLKTAHMILAIAKADGQLHDTELALFRHVLSRWGLSLEQLASGSATI